MRIKKYLYIAILMLSGAVLVSCFDQEDLLLYERVTLPMPRDTDIADADVLPGIDITGVVEFTGEGDLAEIKIILRREGVASACSNSVNAITVGVTDADASVGDFIFKGVPRGRYTICAEAVVNNVHQAMVVTGIAVDPDVIEQSLSVGTMTLEVVETQGLAFDLTVVDATDPDNIIPIPFASVSIKQTAIEGAGLSREERFVDEKGTRNYTNSDVKIYSSRAFDENEINFVFSLIVSKEGYSRVEKRLSYENITAEEFNDVIIPVQVQFELNDIKPVRLGTGNDWIDLQVAEYHIGALRADGRLYTWGNYDLSAAAEVNPLPYSTVPRLQGERISWHSLASIARNINFTIRNDGSLWGWFDGADQPSKAAMGGWTSFNAITRSAVADDGTLWVWAPIVAEDGSLAFNWQTNLVDQKRLGNDNDWKSVHDYMALKDEGTGMLWTLGNLCEATDVAHGFNDYGHLHPMGEVGGWQSVALIGLGNGRSSVVLVLRQMDGALLACGQRIDSDNPSHGEEVHEHAGMQEAFVYIGDENVVWSQITASERGSMMIRADGSLWRWGGFFDAAPVQVGSDYNWKKIATSPYFGAGIKTDGSLWTWNNEWWDGIGP